MFFPPASRIIEFNGWRITERRKVAGVEERAVVGEFRFFVAVAEAVGSPGHVERHLHALAGCERLFQLVDAVDVACRGTDQMKWTVEMNLRNRIVRVREVNL